jgi:hypothetical protein
MPELTLHHIDQISQDLSRQEIVYSHLLSDLIDHVCCDVEFEMQNGLSFSEAYSRVKQKIGKRRIKEIQEETLYAVDTKYRYMKNTMKTSAIAGTVLLGFAALFKIQHWPFAGVMMTLGALILAFVFMPSALGVLWKETHNRKRIILLISAFLTGMFFIMGTLFKIQHWPAAAILLSLAALSGLLLFLSALFAGILKDQENKSMKPLYIIGSAGFIFYMTGMFFKIQHWPLASVLMLSGVLILGVVVLPVYTWLKWKEESFINPRFLFILIGSLAIIIPGALVNLNLQQSYEDGYYLNQVQQQAMYNYLYMNNKSFMISYQDSLCYPQMELLHSRTTGLIKLISDVQTKMVQESEGEPGMPAVSADQLKQTETGIEIQYKLLSSPFNTNPVRDFLMPECTSRMDLNIALNDYQMFLSSLASEGNIQEYVNMLTPSNYLPGESAQEQQISLMSGLHSLELLKNSILTIESSMLINIARHK